jgi:hypothetical protein
MGTLLAALALAATPAPADESAFQLEAVSSATLRASCAAGDPTACHRLGRRYDLGNGGVATAAFYTRACDLGVLVSRGMGALARGESGTATSARCAGFSGADRVSASMRGVGPALSAEHCRRPDAPYPAREGIPGHAPERAPGGARAPPGSAHARAVRRAARRMRAP